MNTNDVVDTLLAAGWRYESLGGELPVLTNAPKGKKLCTRGGDWVNAKLFTHKGSNGSVCNHCHGAEVKENYYKQNARAVRVRSGRKD